MAIKYLPVRSGRETSLREFQQRMTEKGRIRTGRFNGKYPEKLATFRLTSADEDLVRKVAEIYGGTPKPYTPQRSQRSEWEVITDRDELGVYVPRQDMEPWLEAWRPGTCIRRCDGETETIKDEPCLCAAGKVGRDDLCKPVIRLQVMLADLPDFGTWRLEPHGENAVAELAPFAPIFAGMPLPRVPAKLRLREETRRPWVAEKNKFETITFYVPYLSLSVATPAQLAVGGDVLSRALAASTAPELEAQEERQAIEATPEPPAAVEAAPAATQAVTLDHEARIVILGKIEQSTTVARLTEIANKLRERGVKDERVKGALKSKAAEIKAKLAIDHQRSLKEAQQRAADGVQEIYDGLPDEPPDDGGHAERKAAEVTARLDEARQSPEYVRCIELGATDAEVFHEGGPMHWLAGHDQAQHYAGEPIDAEVVEPEPEPEPQATADLDEEAELAAYYTTAGQYGWTTAQANDKLKAFAGVASMSKVTAAQVHAMRQDMRKVNA